MKKITFKMNKRHTIYSTMIACAVGLWLLYSRFGLTKESMLSYLLSIVVGLAVLIGLSAFMALIIRLFQRRGK